MTLSLKLWDPPWKSASEYKNVSVEELIICRISTLRSDFTSHNT